MCCSPSNNTRIALNSQFDARFQELISWIDGNLLGKRNNKERFAMPRPTAAKCQSLRRLLDRQDDARGDESRIECDANRQSDELGRRHCRWLVVVVSVCSPDQIDRLRPAERSSQTHPRMSRSSPPTNHDGILSDVRLDLFYRLVSRLAIHDRYKTSCNVPLQPHDSQINRVVNNSSTTFLQKYFVVVRQQLYYFLRSIVWWWSSCMRDTRPPNCIRLFSTPRLS